MQEPAREAVRFQRLEKIEETAEPDRIGSARVGPALRHRGDRGEVDDDIRPDLAHERHHRVAVADVAIAPRRCDGIARLKPARQVAADKPRAADDERRSGQTAAMAGTPPAPFARTPSPAISQAQRLAQCAFGRATWGTLLQR